MTITAFLVGHIRAASERYDVTVVANCHPGALPDGGSFPAAFVSIPLQRKISPGDDLHSLWALYRLFRRERFDLVHSVSPKAGLLAMLAAWLARVPHRAHTFTGQVWVTRLGWRREALKFFDRVLAALATAPLTDSPSQRDFLVAEGIAADKALTVIGKGSICGVNPARFRPDPEARTQVRSELSVSDHACMILFVGRLNRDKGVPDLVRAFATLCSSHEDVMLVCVGPDEEGRAGDMQGLLAADRYRCVGFTSQPERFMAAADIFCLPSYREGFGMVIVEAGAVGLPAVASRIYGVTDAVEDGVTGILFPPGDEKALISALARLVEDVELRQAMGNAARVRALRDFAELDLTQGLMAFYGKMLG